MFVGSRTLATRLDSAPDAETILDYARKALERPRDAAFWDDSLYVTHTLGFYWAPDSDDTVAQSNYRTVLEDLSEAYKRCPDAVETASVGHWTYSSFNCIRIRVLYANGEVHPAFADAVAIWEALEAYPLYSDDDHSELESELWDEAITKEIDYALSEDTDALFEYLALGSEDAELFRSDVAEYLYENVAYQHEVGYIPEEDMSAAIERATALIGSVRPDNSFVPLPGL